MRTLPGQLADRKSHPPKLKVKGKETNFVTDTDTERSVIGIGTLTRGFERALCRMFRSLQIPRGRMIYEASSIVVIFFGG